MSMQRGWLTEEMVIQIHQKSPSASLDDWLEEASKLNENFQSFMLAGHLDHEFYDVIRSEAR